MIKGLLDLNKLTRLKDIAPTPQNIPTYVQMNSAASSITCQAHINEIWGILLDKRKVPCGWPACLRRQPPRVAFKINNIYVVDNEESSNYEEPRERHPKSNINYGY